MPPRKESKPQQQHWVPKVYLKNFATTESIAKRDPKVWVWDKPSGQAREGLARVGAICSQKFLYTPLLNDGTRDWSMEDDLGKAETRAGDVWPVLVGSESALSDPATRAFLAHFIALMHLRNAWLFDKTHQAVNLARKL